MMVPKHREKPREVSQGDSCRVRYQQASKVNNMLHYSFTQLYTYIAQPFNYCSVSGGNSQVIDGQIQQYSSCSNDVIEVGTSELDKSEYRMAKWRE